MQLGTMLEVAIGLALVFLFMGLMVSAIQEVAAAALQSRGTLLLKTIRRLLLADGGDSGPFYKAENHPLLLAHAGSGQPSYVPARNFALMVISVLTDLQSAVAARNVALERIAEAIDKLPAGRTKESLAALLVDVQGIDEFIRRLETWFDDAMDRATELYKNWSERNMFAFAMIVAVALNIDTLRIAKRLWNDDDLRASVVKIAEKMAEDCQDLPCAKVAPASDGTAAAPPKPDDASAGAAGGAAPSPGTAPTTPPATPGGTDGKDPNLQAAIDNVKRVKQLFAETALPIGWEKVPENVCLSEVFWMFLGWVITAFAATKGAPFWFNALQQLLQLRSAAPKPARADKTADGATGATRQ